jgi:hypothetical protein
MDTMSINAMTNAAMSRRPDFEPANRVPRNLEEIARATGVVPPAPADAAGQSGGGVNTALQTLTTYIPTEVLTLHVAAVAALGPLKGEHGHNIGRWLPFWCFLVGTPLVVWVAFATKIKAAGKAIPAHPRRWPVWEMTAGTIAYAAWTFALPDSPFVQFQDRWYSPALAGLAVLIVSYGLGAVAPLMQVPLSQ